MVPVMPPLPPPDAGTLLEGIDPLLVAAHDGVRGLLLGLEAVAGNPVAPSSYDGADSSASKGA
jgi:hypothetical protein